MKTKYFYTFFFMISHHPWLILTIFVEEVTVYKINKDFILIWNENVFTYSSDPKLREYLFIAKRGVPASCNNFALWLGIIENSLA